MKALYTQTPMICKLNEIFSKIFSKETKPTQQHIIDLLMSVLGLDGFRSVKFSYSHFIQSLSDFKLKSYYFMLNESKIDIDTWMEALILMAISIIPKELSQQLLVLSIDDTMVEKFGDKFECREKLFDHAAHHGSLYLKGHCFVSLMISVPIIEKGTIRYISIPVGYRMWTKEKTKLAMTEELVRKAMKIIGSDRQVCFCCDSWFPKKEVLSLVDDFDNFAMICNVRHDTVLYELPPEPTHKRGRPKNKGEKIDLNEFEVEKVEGTDFYVSCRKVVTNIFKKRQVYAIVTRTITGGPRLFICTKSPNELNFDLNVPSLGKALHYAKKNSMFLPLTIYSLRWNIEVSFYEMKKFWSLEDYMLRSKTGIERLINLLMIVYSLMTLLPFYDSLFFPLADKSPQETRFLIGWQIQQELFFATFEIQPTSSKINFSSFFACAG